MDNSAGIGPSIHIKGQVTAREPLRIAGYVDGTIDVDGHALTVDAGGRVKASIMPNQISHMACPRSQAPVISGQAGRR